MGYITVGISIVTRGALDLVLSLLSYPSHDCISSHEYSSHWYSSHGYSLLSWVLLSWVLLIAATSLLIGASHK